MDFGWLHVSIGNISNIYLRSVFILHFYRQFYGLWYVVSIHLHTLSWIGMHSLLYQLFCFSRIRYEIVPKRWHRNREQQVRLDHCIDESAAEAPPMNSASMMIMMTEAPPPYTSINDIDNNDGNNNRNTTVLHSTMKYAHSSRNRTAIDPTSLAIVECSWSGMN